MHRFTVLGHLSQAHRSRGARPIGGTLLGLSLAAISHSTAAQADPTPTPAPGGIAPQPSPTPPSSVPPTPTMGAIAPAPSPTPTSEPEPVGPSPTPPSWPEPTPTPSVLVQPDPAGDDQQTVPCPHPYSPFNWFCWPGPGGRWFPVIPPADFAQTTGVAGYGYRGHSFFDITDVANVETWEMEAIAWDAQGGEMAQLHLAFDPQTETSTATVHTENQAETLRSSVEKRSTDRGEFELSIELNGKTVDLSRVIEGESAYGEDAKRADAVFGLWGPLFAELQGLIDGLEPGDGLLQGPGKCAVAGFLAGNACLASLSYTLFSGNFVCDDAFELAGTWCN